MKRLIYIALSICTFTTVLAQTGTTLNHSTLQKVKIQYETVSTTGTTDTASLNMVVLPKVTLTLKPNATVTKVYLQILNKQDSSLIYQVNYMVSAAPVTGTTGQPLFYTEDSKLVISATVPVLLNTYVYKIHTQDQQGNNSAEYITRH